MSAPLALYRFLTGGVGAVVVPVGGIVARRGSAWRARFGAPEEAASAAGGPWIHAASLGEASAALRWVEALVADGYRAPLFVTARTAAGLARLRADGGANATAAMAPIDFPQAVRRVIREAAPMRLDLMETELWPNLVMEAHAAGLPVVVVSATVSARTAGRLRSLGLAGNALFGPLHVLAQSERHAERFRLLGVSAERCRVIGDMKADRSPGVDAVDAAPDPEARRLLLFASLRPGEEGAAVAVARMLAARRDAAGWRWIVAPRHERGVAPLRAAFVAAGIPMELRDEASRGSASVVQWASQGVGGDSGLGALSVAGSGRGSAARSVGVLATRGELPALFTHARAALVGGTFAPWGGHNVLEPAMQRCPVIVGPHHEEVEAGVEQLRSRGAGAVAKDGTEAAALLSRWLDEPASPRGEAALNAARAAAGAARRGLEALRAWGLEP